MTEQQAEAYVFSPLGGRLCLNFANTTAWYRSAGEAHGDHLDSYADLVEFGRQMGVISDDEAVTLRAEAERHPGEAATMLEQARRLRGALYRVFLARSEGGVADEHDLDVVNREVADAYAHARLVQGGDGFELRWEGHVALDKPLWAVAQSALEVLTSTEVTKVHACDGETCGWLFVDTSKNHSRRWCSMADCGNRAKARRHYHRAKGGEG